MYSTNYKNTFIEVADDCPVSNAQPPPLKENASIARLQYELLINNPYGYSSDEVVFEVYKKRKNIPKTALAKEREIFFSKGQPCMRSSPLAKKYGWGVHNDENGKIAIYPMESKEYKEYVKNVDLDHKKAMRTNRI